jgi:hypothetical protein
MLGIGDLLLNVTGDSLSQARVGRIDVDSWALTVERTKLPEMKDFLLVNVGHTFIMNDEEVIRQVLYFLRHSVFDRSNLATAVEADDGKGIKP